MIHFIIVHIQLWAKPGARVIALGFLFFDLSVNSKLQFSTSKVVRLMVRLTFVSSNTTKKNKESIDNKFM